MMLLVYISGGDDPKGTSAEAREVPFRRLRPASQDVVFSFHHHEPGLRR